MLELTPKQLERLRTLDGQDPPRVNIELMGQVWETISANVVAELMFLDRIDVDDAFDETGVDGWDQSHWRCPHVDSDGNCRTRLCFAGWTVQIDAIERGDPSGGWLVPHRIIEQAAQWHKRHGSTVAPDMAVYDAATEHPALLVARPDDPNTIRVKLPGPNAETVDCVEASERAIRVLGLTLVEGARLFSSVNTLRDMFQVIDEITVQERIRRTRRQALQNHTEQENGE